MRSQTKIFAQLVKDFMHKPKVCVPISATCAQVSAQMAEHNVACCVVVDSYGKLAGILRMSGVLLDAFFRAGPETLVEEVMDRKVQTISCDEYLYHAIGHMRAQNINELVVVDEAVHPIGVIYLQGAIEIAAHHLMQRIDRLSGQGDVKNLKNMKAAQVELAHDLFEDHMPACDVQQLLTHVNKDIYSRIITDHLRNMKAEGWGPPPVEFCAIVMGSGGRGENYLYPDQDNGFILEDYDDEDHNRIDQFFRELAQRMCHDLNDVGFPYCKGNVMATNPVWRKSLSQWVSQVQLWGRKRNPTALRLADIFFDFQPVWGKQTLATDLRKCVLEILKNNHFFFAQMHQTQMSHGVALGLFGRLVGEPDDEGQGGKIDLKYRATLPLVESIRLLSLQRGVEETSTLERIDKLYALDGLSKSEQEDLSRAFKFITGLLLRRQVQEFEAREPVTHFIAPETLNKREKDNLMDGLRHIEIFRKRLKGEFTGDVF